MTIRLKTHSTVSVPAEICCVGEHTELTHSFDALGVDILRLCQCSVPLFPCEFCETDLVWFHPQLGGEQKFEMASIQTQWQTNSTLPQQPRENLAALHASPTSANKESRITLTARSPLHTFPK